MELFHFRFMQTDPNWANFLFPPGAHKLQLIDFGASREYTKEFMDGWYRLMVAAMGGDREACRVESLGLGYLTGREEEVMLEAHVDSMILVASELQSPAPTQH
jgi:aarF domain-containing kinase